MPMQETLQMIHSQSIHTQSPICDNMQKLTMQQQQQQQQNPLLQKAKAFNQSFFTQPSQDRHVTRSRSAPPASTTRECQRGMSNFCSPEGSGNFVGLQCSSVNQSVIEAEQARATPLNEVVSQQLQKQQRQSKMPVNQTSCLANAPGGNPYQMSQSHDQQSSLNNTTCCSANNESTNLGINYGSWQQQQQQLQLQQQYYQQQPQHLCCQQQPKQLQQYQQQQPQYYHFQQQQHHHIPYQQQQQQQEHCLNNNESFNRFEPHLNSTMIGQESPWLPDTNCIQRPLANRSCMPQAQPYRPPSLGEATPTPTPGPTATNTQRCNATYKPLPPSTRMMQPPTPSNSCGQRMMGTPKMTQQRLRSDNRSFDETSYMQLPMPSKQQQQQQRQLPQSQCQPQVTFRSCPISTPRPKTSTGSQCCTQPIQSQGPHFQSPMAMNQSLPAQNSLCPSATSSPRGSRSPQTFEMSTFIEERSQSQINSNDLTPEERFVQRTKSLFFDILVKDHTCPGVIQETLDGKEDFNAYAFEIAFCGNVPNKPKPIDPISIIEAIKLRIDYERTEIRKNHSANTSTNSDLEKPHKDQSRDRRLPRTPSQQSRDRSGRAPSEGKGRRRRSGVTEEDIDNHFAGKNKSEVNDAVCAFLQAEAEYRSTNVEGRKDFEANVNAYEPKLMGKDIKTNTYTATTKPID
ncbi:probable basic-leucine zipper transcription factor Q [Drosophila willistoni]|uniref:probable basic-leucine zipper transcription factor Q n=1 Tax=Drosophila willistoni TaxID=7260 RepID=UPI000C26C41C|nr:probable basic-leucine zipper transcription factor Q [Drosophila willistoni]